MNRVDGLWNLFGKEYGWATRWTFLERYYIRTFGLVDLHSRLRARCVIEEVNKHEWKQMIDIGSGTGAYSFYFSRNPSNYVWGIDVDSTRIEDCERISKQLSRINVRFHKGDDSNLLNMFDSSSFDIALAIEVLQYVPDIRFALSEMHRILKPGGILIGHVPALGYLREFEKTLFNDSSLKDLLRKAGFGIILLTQTFGGNIQKLCEIFNYLCRFRLLMALIFPLLLLTSTAFRIKSPSGSYRLFVARKPILFQ